MAGNTIGTIFRLTSFGESHGKAIGGIVDGCPAGLEIDLDYIQQELNRRKPGQSSVTTTREEDDSVEFLSGIFEGETTGTPIAFIVKNNNQKSNDYNHLKDTYRPSHADYTYEKKYGLKDHRGGGRSSARETIARVVAGAIAKLYLMHHEISIQAYSSQIGDVKLEKNYTALDLSKIDDNIVRCPDEKVANKMIAEINKVKAEGDTIGGVISCVIKGCPLGLGEPVFDKLQADLAKAMLSINAAKGFEYGAGFGAAKMKGSEHNDQFSFDVKKNKVYTNTNFSGGIQGGISNGEDIYFNVAFKPVATIMKPQQTINKKNKELTLEAKGRHDACVLPRAVPIVEAMAAIVLTDHLLRNNCAVCKY